MDLPCLHGTGLRWAPEGLLPFFSGGQGAYRIDG